MIAITVIVPVYNAAAWLPRFVLSLKKQTFENFEVLFIDDASTDTSKRIINDYASADPRFKLLSLTQNSGCGVARNFGIKKATGETICFADPDDILPETSLEVRYAAYKKHKAIVRACHDEVYSDGTVAHHEVPPPGIQNTLCKLPEDCLRFGVDPFLCAHWTWLFPTNFLRRINALNGENMQTAEDIVLLIRIFFHVSRLVWIPDTVYHWMKRSDSLSNTVYTPEHYADYFQCCDIFYQEAKENRQVRFADAFFNNYLVIYTNHLLWQISTGKSSEADAQKAVAAMLAVGDRAQVFSRCLPEMQNFPLRYEGLWRLWHIRNNPHPSMIQRLATAHNLVIQCIQEAKYAELRKKGWSQEVTFDALDTASHLLRARYLFCDSPPDEAYQWDEALQQPEYCKNRLVFEGNGYTVFERILWLALPPDAAARCRLMIAQQCCGLDHTVAEVRRAFRPTPLNDQGFPQEIRALRHLAHSRPLREKFKDAWLFLDKDTEADDNAEHLYRWVRRHHPEVNAWFVLKREVPDWPRLKQEGFQLIPFGGLEHKALFLCCAKLISSQMDRYIFSPLEERFFADFPRPHFICLPHGVTKDDVSEWFNTIPFDLFIAATHQEAASIADDGTPYVMTKKEVRLGGFPRYDKWVEPAEPENVVFVMPTWRANLVGVWDGKGQHREINPNFFSSPYVKVWADLFNDPRLKDILERWGYRIVFFAHPCFEDYVAGMPFPEFVEKRSKRQGSIIESMQKSKVMITDFSSVAYDMAYMRKPVLYYQCETKADFVRSQRWTSGYIDYDGQGFGPVCHDRSNLLDALEKCIRSGCVMEETYVARAAKTFAYHDGKNCERAYNFIIAG